MAGTNSGKVQGDKGPPPIKGVEEMTLGQLWNEIMIKQYLAGQIAGYDIAIQRLAPGMKRGLDNLLATIDTITARIKAIAAEMGRKPPEGTPPEDETRRQAELQAKLTAATTERSKVQIEISTTQATMQSVLQRGMTFLQQANSFVQELGQIWNQMAQGMG